MRASTRRPSLNLSGPSDDTQYDRYNGDDDQDVDDAAGVKTAKKANGPNDD